MFDCSLVGHRPSPCDRAIIRELSESFFALNFLETGCIGHSDSSLKVVDCILSTGLASPALHRLHSVISDFMLLSPTRQLFGEKMLRLE